MHKPRIALAVVIACPLAAQVWANHETPSRDLGPMNITLDGQSR